MKKNLIIKSLFLLLSSPVLAQEFTEIEVTNGNGIIYGEAIWIDSQNDNIKEAIVSGASDNYDHYATLINNHEGQLSRDSVNQLEGLSLSSLDKADFNQDGYMDLIMNGYNGTENIVNLYINNTDGSYTLTQTDIIGTTNGRIRTADFNNDNLSDIIITGVDTSGTYSARVYLQNAQGDFDLKTNSLMDNYFGDIAILDGDADGDLDILLTGFDLNYTPNAKFYLNDGTGIFTEKTDAGIEGIYFSSSSVADYDMDGDLDILINGFNTSYTAETALYSNDGSNIFTKLTSTPFENLYFGTADFVDSDLDGDMDIFITGQNSSSVSKSYFYKNDNGVYSIDQAITDTILGLSISTTYWEDYDNDLDLDLIYSGFDTTSTRQIRVYINNLNEPTFEYASIETTDKNSLFTLFPNPNDGEFSIRLNHFSTQKAIYSIYDITGKLITNGQIENYEKKINISHIKKGTYILKLATNDAVYTEKFSIK